MSDPTSIKTQSDTDRLWARSLLYQLLGGLFRHPASRDMGADLKDFADWREAVEIFSGAGQGPLTDSLQRLIEEITRTNRQEWIVQYESCLGHTARGAAPCYELEYGEEHSHREPQQLGDITAFYHAFGLKIDEKLGERPDHISVECEFMWYLLFKEAYALAHDGPENALICRRAAERFLGEHLALWVPSFSLRLSKHAGEGIMKETADFALAFISEECRQAGIKAGPAGLPLRAVSSVETDCVSCLASFDHPR